MSKESSMSKKVLGAALGLGLAITANANAIVPPQVNVDASSIFQLTEVSAPSLLMIATDKKDGDHKCGEGKCGEGHCKGHDGKCGEGHCKSHDGDKK